ncbi:PEGA domain-containing protein [Sorangium sp. So ce1000]|uniref:PEGA domain-containing protein n=1 Tax=Sorangium sp. So ce1000 TaxID=3133325 RepID=UPI003F61C6B2
MERRGLRRSSWHRSISAAALGAALSAPPSARAQSKEELAEARALFQEAVALSAANNCAAALAKFQAVANVRRTPQVLFNIAECEARLGKLVSALGNYRIAAAAADGDPRAYDVSAHVGARIEDLEARIPKLAIRRGEGALTATILLDGAALGASEMSADIPVDPGPHVVSARVGDREAARETVTLEERDAKTVEITIADLPAAPQPASASPAAASAESSRRGAPSPAGRRSKVPGLVVLGAGIASGAAGGIFLGLRAGTLSDLDALCGGDRSCPPSARPVADRGRLYTGVAEAAIGLGVVGVAAGIALLVTSGGAAAAEPEAGARAAGAAAAGRAGAAAAGRAGAGLFRAAVLPQAPGADVAGLSVAGRF